MRLGSAHMISISHREATKENQNRRQEKIDSNLLEDEAVILHSSDHPGMVLVSAPLTGNNYLSWSPFVKIYLGAKTKLNLIDGSSTPPVANSPQFAIWKKADCMVLSWLLNSICKDISESFIYASSSRDLVGDRGAIWRKQWPCNSSNSARNKPHNAS